MKEDIKKNSGFTLVEILVAMTVFVVASIMFMATFNLVSQSTMRAEFKRTVQQDARFAIEEMSREIRNGWNFQTNTDGSQLSFAFYQDKEVYYKKIYAGYNNDGIKTIFQQICSDEALTNCSAGVPMVSAVVGLEEGEDSGLSFRVIQPASEYPIVEIRLRLKRQNADRFASPISLITRVTSRMRTEEGM